MLIEPAFTAADKAPDTDSGAADQLLSRVIAQTGQRPERADGIATGMLEAIDTDGTPLVSIPAWALARVRAQTIAAIDPADVGRGVALGFDNGDPARPIILGLMLTGATAAVPGSAPEVVLDGERVVLEAASEVELRCGEAAIVLSADGRIELRGTYITSYASATQRILGGSVNVN